MQQIVQRTAAVAAKKQPFAVVSKETAGAVFHRELQLIQSRDIILDPQREFRASRLPGGKQ